MKFFAFFFIFLSFAFFAQETSKSVFPKQYSVSSSFQNEDIFVSLGAIYNLREHLFFEFKYGTGVRRTFFQQALFSKVDGVFSYDFLKNEKWNFGPSLQFSMMSLAPVVFKPVQRYYTAEVGYTLVYGSKIKAVQSSFIGFRTTEFPSSSDRYSFIGYAFQLGFRYEI